MLHIVIDGPPQFATRFTQDRASGIVVIKSDLPLKNGSFQEAIHELDTQDVTHRALGFAVSQGVADARVNGLGSSVYPCVANGVPYDLVRGPNGEVLDPKDPRMKIDHYRRDIPVTKRLV